MHDQHKVAADVIAHAVEVYGLEQSLGGLDTEALSKAISAALIAHERQVTERNANILRALADATEETEEDDADGQAFGLRWGAVKLLEDIPLISEGSPSYTPQEDDIIEIVLTGRVNISEEACEHCGHESQSIWSITDYRTGATYFFDKAEIKGKLNVRVLFDGSSDDE